MHIDSISLLTNIAVITVGVLAAAFLVWFLLALTMESNGADVRCRVEYRVKNVLPNVLARKPIKEIDPSKAITRPPKVLVTHRAAVALIPKYECVDETRPARPYLVH